MLLCMPCNHGDRKLFCVLSANDKAPEDIHNPYSKVLFRDFSNYLIVLAYRIYAEQLESVRRHRRSVCFHTISSNNTLTLLFT